MIFKKYNPKSTLKYKPKLVAAKNIELEIMKQAVSLIVAAFGFVAALAWNSLLQEIFSQMLGTSNMLNAMFIYAISVTTIAVLVIVFLGRFVAKLEHSKNRARRNVK